MNRLLRDTPLLVGAILWSSIISCGGKTADESPDVALRSTAVSSGGTGALAGGGAATTGGGTASGGAATGGAATGGAATGGAATGGTTMGAAGCANRSVVYADDVQLSFSGRGISGLGECTPTCGQPYGSYQSIPAGPCDEDPECVMMIAGGIPRYFLCSCVSRWWSCVGVSGVP